MSYHSNGKVVLKTTSVEGRTKTAPLTLAKTLEKCALMRLRIGDGPVRNVTSASCDSENFASILFEGQGTGGLASDLGFVSITDVFTAQSVKIELPLTDGSSPVLEIAPQEPSFQLFAAKCGQPLVDPRRGYLGASVRNAMPDLDHAVLVSEALPGGPAARAGLKAGDAITAVDGKPVESADLFSLSILSRSPGTVVNLDVLREGKPVKITVTLDRRPTAAPSPPVGQPTGPTGRVLPPLFTGTADTFATALAGYLERTAPWGGISAHDFDREIALIVNTVKVCAQITPQMAASVAQGAAA